MENKKENTKEKKEPYITPVVKVATAKVELGYIQSGKVDGGGGTGEFD